ncbi:MAG: aminoglycoside phosphotransferase family protein, partial [Pseudomonadales bacterium]
MTARGSGYQNLAYESSDGWLIRVGSTVADGSRLIEEAALLERIAAAVTFAVPAPVFVEQSETFPGGVMVYRCLRGIALDPAHPETLTRTIAQQLGEALVELHEVAPRKPLRETASQNWRRWLVGPRDWLDEALHPDERSTLEAWIADIKADGLLEGFAPRFVHGDL